MSTGLRRALRAVAEFFGLTEPEPPRLNCDCFDVAHRYVCRCEWATCEQHRNDPHDCEETTDAQ